MDFGRIGKMIDLFTEGIEVYLGDDPETQKPIVVWVNKLNSFEVEEARMDGQVRRSERMAALGRENSPERAGVLAEISVWSHDQLATKLVDLRKEELYLDALNDLQEDSEQRERLDRIQRLPQLLADSNASADDPRRETLAEDQRTWMAALSKAQEKRQRDAHADAVELTREDLETAYFEQWRSGQTIDVFMQERRTTQMFLALRECDAVDVSTDVKARKWDHSKCDHSKRLMSERSQVNNLPDVLVEKFIDAIDSVSVSPRQAGNSDAPASSSASLEPSSAAEATSRPSTPEATPPVVPTS